MATVDEIVARVVARRPFAVLGYSAEDAVWCPACLRSAGGLSPGRADSSGRPIVPLYARDNAVREELCENCERPLYELLAAARLSPEPRPVTARLRVYAKRTALSFDRVPPVEVRSELKATGWRWDPRFRIWWSVQEEPTVPAGVTLPGPNQSAVMARGPVIRKRS